MEKLKIGFIGGGDVFEKHHYPTLQHLPQYNLIAVSDTESLQLDKLAKEYNIPFLFSDYREMLNLPLDIAAVCSPVTTHTEIALDILDAGKHLFLEKPAAFSVQECDSLIEKAKASTGKIIIGYNQRYIPNITKAKKIVDSGELGEIQAIQFLFSSGHHVTELPEWRKYRQKGGGAFIEESCHILDLFTWFSKHPITRVVSASSNLGGCDDNPVAFVAETKNHVLFEAIVSDTLPGQNQFTILGKNKILRVFAHRFDGIDIQPRGVFDGDIKKRITDFIKFFQNLPQSGKLWKLGGAYNLSYYHMWKDLYKAITEDNPVLNSLQETRRVQLLLQALIDSADRGHWISIEDGQVEEKQR